MPGMMRYREDVHAHYCRTCDGYAPCFGPYPDSGECLLTDRCVGCDSVLQGSVPVRVTVQGED